jgi:hypothetical protein
MSASVPSGKFGGTKRCHWWMHGKDAGSDVWQRHTRIRGRSQAPPGAPRLPANLPDGTLAGGYRDRSSTADSSRGQWLLSAS